MYDLNFFSGIAPEFEEYAVPLEDYVVPVSEVYCIVEAIGLLWFAPKENMVRIRRHLLHPMATPEAGKLDPGIHNLLKTMDSRLRTSGMTTGK